MNPELIYVGSLSVGVAIPLFLQLAIAIDVAIAGLIPELSAKITGYLALQGRLSVKPPSLAANVELAAKINASFLAAASLGFTPPSVSFGFDLVGALIIKLQLQLKGLKAALDLALQIKDLAAAAGVKLFIYKGRLVDLGATLDAQVGVKAGLDLQVPIYLPLLVVDSSANPETVTALETIFKQSP